MVTWYARGLWPRSGHWGVLWGWYWGDFSVVKRGTGAEIGKIKTHGSFSQLPKAAKWLKDGWKDTEGRGEG